MNLAPSCHLSLLPLIVIGLNLTVVYGLRIIGGQPVQPYDIKYQASLRFMNYHFCGGTLIHRQWVVSAAHCWRPRHLLKVILGEHHISKYDGFEQWFTVPLVIRHHQYQHWTFDNDIMLLKLDRAAFINRNIVPASLPDPNSPPLADFTPCTVSGWGVTSLKTYKLSSVLRSVDVDIFNKCHYYYYFRITDNMICAGWLNGGKDSCLGDSGGPLICNGRLEGIVSWGIGCAYANYPGVYTKVRNYLGWINWITQNA